MKKTAILNREIPIKLAIFDVDGVLTNGNLILDENGSEYKIFHVRDGLGLQMLHDSGCEVAIISGRSCKIVAERMMELDIDLVYQNQSDKSLAFQELYKKLNINPQEIAYTGDDLIDLSAMRQAGLAIAVADAHPLVIEAAHWITEAKGGRGAAREVCELIMQANGTFDHQIKHFLQA